MAKINILIFKRSLDKTLNQVLSRDLMASFGRERKFVYKQNRGGNRESKLIDC